MDVITQFKSDRINHTLSNPVNEWERELETADKTLANFITAHRTAPAEGENTEWLSENHKKRLRKYREKMGEKT
jgi:succinate dehydrogenase flavin-adding protein (antitoxin of CptAB toxin-antitoxin module)